MQIPKIIDLKGNPYPDTAEISDLLKSDQAPTSLPSESSRSAEMMEFSKALISIANFHWRASVAVLDQESKEPKPELKVLDIKRIGNALEGMRGILAALGIRVIDRLGDPFNAGLPEQVVSEEPQEGISKEQIIRTIRPTIMWQQTMVQRGEIDIAVPAVKK
jgi:hypothetical protein